MCDAPFFASLAPSDRLRILVNEIRHVGPAPWLLRALDSLADELEPSDPEAGPASGGDAEALR